MYLGFYSKFACAIALVFIVSIECKAEDDQHYSPFNLSSQDIQVILNQTIIVPAPAKQCADISFLGADMKYCDGVLKFCELGDGTYMSFTRDMQVEIDRQLRRMHAPCWGVLWHYVKQFNKPVWFVGKIRNRNALALDECIKLGGQYVSDLQLLEKNTQFKNSRVHDFVKTGNVCDYKGIVVYCARSGSERDGQEIEDFKKNYPEFIFVNSVMRKVVGRKDSTYDIFHDAGLSDFVPQTSVFPKIYNQHLVDEIERNFAGPNLMLKPLAGTCSMGVTMIHKNELAQTLALILMNDKKILKQLTKIPWLAEWSIDTEPGFMVSEYVPSKILFRDGKPYDPTMRMLCMLRHDQGNMYVTVIGAFWKIPPMSLVDEVALTQKHVTRAHLVMSDPDAFHSGILVEREDMDKVRQLLHSCLPMLYKTIMERYA